MWNCECDCGKKTISRTQQLTNGQKISCGCMSSRKTIGERARKHGLFGKPVYKVWSGIIQRCTNPNNIRWKDYGGRGITVCDEWRKSSVSFCKWAEENGYYEGLQIDRIDPDKGYTPTNCRWITAYENTSRAKRLPWPLMENGCAMLLRGMSARSIAKALSVDPTTVGEWKKLLEL